MHDFKPISEIDAKFGIEQLKTPDEMLDKVLEWLEINVPAHLSVFLASCRREWEKIRSAEPGNTQPD